MSDGKEKNRNTIVKALELPRDLFGGEPLFTMTGDGELIIENHRGILLCSPEQMQIRTFRNLIAVEGEDMLLESYDPDAVKICGRISQIGINGL